MEPRAETLQLRTLFTCTLAAVSSSPLSSPCSSHHQRISTQYNGRWAVRMLVNSHPQVAIRYCSHLWHTCLPNSSNTSNRYPRLPSTTFDSILQRQFFLLQWITPHRYGPYPCRCSTLPAYTPVVDMISGADCGRLESRIVPVPSGCNICDNDELQR